MARPLKYEERKLPRKLRMTETGWEGLRSIAASHGISIAELLEQIGRGKEVGKSEAVPNESKP